MSTEDLFRARLDQMIDPRHPLAVLATRIPWSTVVHRGSRRGTVVRTARA